MSRIHVVQQGECLSTIAKKYHFKWQTLWDFGENSALRKKRKSPDILFPGDEIHIPEPAPTKVGLDTGQTHQIVFTLPIPRIKIRILLNGEPLAGEPFVLSVDGGGSISGETNGQGLVDVEMPFDALEGKIDLPGISVKRRLNFGALDPPATVSGAQARLRQLGASWIQVDGRDSEIWAEALKSFQRAKGIDATGKLDDKTIKALEDAYGC